METDRSLNSATDKDENSHLLQQQFYNQPATNQLLCDSVAFDNAVSTKLYDHRLGNGLSNDQDQEQCPSTPWVNPDGEKTQGKKPKPVALSDYAALNAVMDEIQKNLSQVKETLAQTSVRCHLSCLRLATLFNPETVEKLSNCVERCEKHKKKIEATLYEDF